MTERALDIVVRIEVELSGTSVIVRHVCADHYQAIELYDRLTASLRERRVMQLTLDRPGAGDE